MKFYNKASDHMNEVLYMECEELGRIPKSDTNDWEHDAFNVTITNTERDIRRCFDWKQGIGVEKYPEISEVLWALTSDMQYADGTFEDFCADLGYNSDSIKDLRLFEHIQDNTKRLRELFTQEELDNIHDVLFEEGM